MTFLNLFKPINKQTLRATPSEEVSLESVTSIVAEIIGVSKNKLDPEANLGHLGFNSIGYNILSQSFSDYFNIEMEATLFYRYSSIRQIVDFLLKDKVV